ncbi:MAG: hypothetical protein ACK4L7_00385, partial [Flavobacteriales bacterium]
MQTIARWIRARATLIIALLTAFIFDRLFYRMALGLNLALFCALICALVVHRVGWSGLSNAARLALAGALLAASMVVVHGSIIAPVMAIL